MTKQIKKAIKKKKNQDLIMLTSSFPRFAGDSYYGKFVYSLSREIQKYGYNITVLSPHAPGLKKKEIIKGIKVHRFSYFFPFSMQKLCYGAGIAPNLKKSILAKLQLPFFFLSQFIYLFFFIIRNNQVTLISHWAIPQGVNGALLKKIFGIKHFIVIHGAGISALSKIPLGTHIIRFIIRNTDRVITVSAYMKSFLNKLAGFDSGALVRSMGIDTKTFIPKNKQSLRKRYGYEKNQKIILFVGRLIEVKGTIYLIRAIKKISARIKNIQVLIIGKGILEKELRQEVKNLKLNPYIRFLGAKPHIVLMDYYNIADLLVIPSVFNKMGQTEAFGLVAIEALSTGLPVVGSRIGGIQEIIKSGKNGILVNPNDPADISKKIISILKGKNLLKLKKNARASALSYDWEVVGKQIKQVINK